MNQKIVNYVELIIKKGINIQKGQILVVRSPIEAADFTREVVKAAYKNGASEVVVHWNDDIVTKYRYIYGDDKIFDEFPDWQRDSLEYYRKKGAAFFMVDVEDPALLKDVDKNRIKRARKVRGLALKEYYDNIIENSNQWCIASVPSIPWAKTIFPELSDKEAVEKLWELILKIMRSDKDDPIAQWDKHLQNLKNRMDYLNSKNFVKLKYKNSLGTDLEIGLPEGHRWLGGSEKSKTGVEFVANMPTEEIFTLPHREKVNGVVYSSKPLVFGGVVIDRFKVVFKDGKVVDFDAETGKETLEKVFTIDENSKYLGEVALVPYDSPVSNSGEVFYNTLYDENASCHLAVGSAYPVCLAGAESLSEEELLKKGVNISTNHVDFMIGTKDLEVTGIQEDGTEISIIKNGNFAFIL